MKVSAGVFWIIAGFFFVTAAIYTIWNLVSNAEIEWVGTVALALCGALGLLVGFYLTKTERAIGGTLAEDRLDAEIDDGDPEIGHFSPWSWWPMAVAFGAGLVMLGIAVGFWIALIGLPIAVVALVGWMYEYYRGYFAR